MPAQTITSDSSENVFKPGGVIESSKAKYVIIELLGEGGFGAVYKVHLDTDKSKEYAVKIEKKMATRKHSKLKMEVAILKTTSTLRAEKSHFTKIIDRGKKPHYFFIVMELVGKALSDLKNAQPGRIFSLSTGLGTACQCLEAIEDLHKQGYIHRDIKPANYAIGLGEQCRVIFLLDFGIARKIMKQNEELKTPREIVGFKGTVKFASLACHKGEDLGKKDDCESWYYLLLDLIVKNGLPWRKQGDKKKAFNCKVLCHQEGTKEFDLLYYGVAKCQNEFVKIINYIDGLNYVNTPDYEFIYKMLKEAANKAGVNMDDPYDWQLTDSEQKSRKSVEKRA